MSTNEHTPISQPTFAVRNTLGKEQVLQDSGRLASDAALQKYFDTNYHKLLPIIAEKVHQEKVQQEKLKAVKARLNFEEASQYSESETPSKRESSRKGSDLDMSVACPEALSQGATTMSHQGKKGPERSTVFKRLDKGVFHRLGDKGKKFASEKHHNKRTSLRRLKPLSGSEDGAGGHQKSKPKRQKSSIEDDLSQPWVCEETDPFTLRIRYFDFPKTQMPSHIKTYDGSEDSEDYLKIFQAAAKTKCWAMPTWCHMFNSTVTGHVKVWVPSNLVDFNYGTLNTRSKKNKKNKNLTDKVMHNNELRSKHDVNLGKIKDCQTGVNVETLEEVRDEIESNKENDVEKLDKDGEINKGSDDRKPIMDMVNEDIGEAIKSNGKNKKKEGKFGMKSIIPRRNGVFLFKFRSNAGPNKLPLWVRLRILPLEAWSTKGISALASRLGTLLIIDQITTNMYKLGNGRVRFARILIDVEATKGLPDKIEIVYKNKDGDVFCKKSVNVNYDWAPPICSYCNVFGHCVTPLKFVAVEW
nr:reverse transcriptase domain-containing protein [Tanacetum cinerariifolium]